MNQDMCSDMIKAFLPNNRFERDAPRPSSRALGGAEGWPYG